ncbi:MAG: TRAP transporter large permease [Cytophagales bacterium]|nr:TRAP transporter large permease [Bernardetiaceae bacterium]MDW8204692.1 TRAP transporter large permease [Cytophagales bacterium]
MEYVILLIFVLMLAIGLPVVFTLGITAVLLLLLYLQADIALAAIAQRMVTAMDSFSLMAIPFFILAGNLMNLGDIAQRIIRLANCFVGFLPGGALMVNVVANMIFGSISGSAVASASAIGAMMREELEQKNYLPALSAAVNAAASTTGLIIPPSNVLIVYSLASGSVSISQLFLAGYLPGLLVGCCLLAFLLVVGQLRQYPTIPFPGFGMAFRYLLHALPALLMIVLVMGGILLGIFTATEASVIAVVYAAGLSYYYARPSWAAYARVITHSAVVTGQVTFLIAASMALSWSINIANLPETIHELIRTFTQDKLTFLLIINILLLLIGIFMDMTPAILVFTPIFLPIVLQLGINPIHFGIVMITNLCIGLCTPPVGTVLFVSAGTFRTDAVSMVKQLLPIYGVLLVALLLITLFPQISLALL